MPDQQTDWRTLPAGPELDALVAERVIGGKPCPVIPWKWTPPLRASRCPMPKFSADPGAAWQVVEAMEKRGLHLQLTDEWMSYPRWRAEFRSLDTRRPGENLEKADTAPLAICRAALAVLEPLQ